MPLVKKRMGDSCKSYTVDKGLAGGAPGTPAAYVGVAADATIGQTITELLRGAPEVYAIDFRVSMRQTAR